MNTRLPPLPLVLPQPVPPGERPPGAAPRRQATLPPPARRSSLLSRSGERQEVFLGRSSHDGCVTLPSNPWRESNTRLGLDVTSVAQPGSDRVYSTTEYDPLQSLAARRRMFGLRWKASSAVERRSSITSHHRWPTIAFFDHHLRKYLIEEFRQGPAMNYRVPNVTMSSPNLSSTNRKPAGVAGFASGIAACYLRLRVAARPARPSPRIASVPGSGIAAKRSDELSLSRVPGAPRNAEGC